MVDLLSDALGVDRIPTELAAWLRTPERADDFAAGIVERCRWLTLPTAQRADAAREWWFARNPDDETFVREEWTKLSDAKRAAMEASWLDGLRATIGTEIYAAWAWHAESGASVRPALLTATACALGLVNWTDEGLPFPVHGIRVPLGLPGYDRLPAFISAARLSEDSSLSGAEIAKLVGVSPGSMSGWKPHISRFATASNDLVFPLGFDAVPDDPTMTPDAIEEQCISTAHHVSVARWKRAQQQENENGEVEGSGDKRRIVEEIPVAQRASLFRAALRIARADWRVPNVFLDALVAVFGLQTVALKAKMRHHLSPTVARSVGLPDDVHDMEAFRIAAGHDAEALRTHVMTSSPDADFATYTAEVDRLLDNGWLTTPRRADLSVSELAERVGRERDTVRRWRKKPEYHRLVRTRVLMPILSSDYWQRQRDKTGRTFPLSI